MASYPYAPPPPPPPASATPTGQYPLHYNSGSQRGGGQSSYGSGARGRGHHDYPSNSRYYQQQQPDYAPSPPAGHYATPQASAPWQSAPAVNHYPPHQQSVPPTPPPAYTTSYGPQGYNSPSGQAYHQPQYPSASARAPHVPSYPAYPNEHPAQRWPEQPQSFPPYSSRGGRGGFHSDRGGHKPDNSISAPAPLRMGFDHNDRTAHSSSPYAPPYQPSPQPGPYAVPPYVYPPAPENPYSAPHTPHNGHSYGGRGGAGRDTFGHSNRGGRAGFHGRGEKFRHRDQRPTHGFNAPQKPDTSVHVKKKKRKTNTLGLTPGEESSDGEGTLDDEEKRLTELLGADAPVIPDMAAWIAERKANFPTRARVEEKKAAAVATAAAAAKAEESKPAVTKIDKDQAKIDKLEKKLSKLRGSIEKRKRAANDEGDEMRADDSPSISDSSDDEEPEVQSSSKPTTAFLPPPPITRADPTNHCKYYSTGGICGKKGKCRFKHDPAVREAALQERTRNGGRMTLKQRLLLNDKDHDDMDVVKAIVEMRSSGRLVDPQNVQTRPERRAEEQATVISAPTTLPTTAGVASLPPNPYTSNKNGTQKNSETA